MAYGRERLHDAKNGILPFDVEVFLLQQSKVLGECILGQDVHCQGQRGNGEVDRVVRDDIIIESPAQEFDLCLDTRLQVRHISFAEERTEGFPSQAMQFVVNGEARRVVRIR